MAHKRNSLYWVMNDAWKNGCTFIVRSGEEHDCIYYKGRDWKQAYLNTKLEDTHTIELHKNGEREFIYYVAGNAPDESISDCTAYGYVDNWTEHTDFGQIAKDPLSFTWEQGRELYHKHMENS